MQSEENECFGPNCSCKESRVIDSRSFDDGASIKRRRECLECGTRFTTFERREEEPIMVLKRDGTSSPSTVPSCSRACFRQLPSVTSRPYARGVRRHGRKRYSQHVPRTDSSSSLGDQVLIRLVDLDKVAYIRFASVYKDFKRHRRASRRTREPDRGRRRFGDRFRHSGVGR